MGRRWGVNDREKLIAALDRASGYIGTLVDMVRRPWEDTKTAADVADELRANFSRDLLSLVSDDETVNKVETI